MSDWQPITTAPQDGTSFLAYFQGSRDQIMIVMSWSGYSNEFVGDYIDTFDFEPDTDGRGPTHRMPLPDPPVTSESTPKPTTE